MSEKASPGVRWREAFAELGERGAPGPGCPEPDRLWATATAKLPVAERHEIIAHTASCASCAAAFRLAMGLSQEAREPAADATDRLPLFASRPWVRWAAPLAALAAILVLAIAVPGWWRRQPVPSRGEETPEIRSLLREGAILPREQALLRWTAGPSGSLYEVRVLTREGREVAVEGGLETPQYRISPPALAAIDADMILYWQVRTLWPDGTTKVSTTFSVRLR